MRPKTLPLALLLLILCACSTLPPSVPATIDPPPVALTAPCVEPGPLPTTGQVTARDLAEWTGGWIKAYGCERSRRADLIDAWPR